MSSLTMRQRVVLLAIEESIRNRGYPPTLREIGDRVGIKSTNGVNDHLHALERKGYIARIDMKARGMRVLRGSDGQTLLDDDTLKVVLDAVRECRKAARLVGAPSFASGYEEGCDAVERWILMHASRELLDAECPRLEAPHG